MIIHIIVKFTDVLNVVIVKNIKVIKGGINMEEKNTLLESEDVSVDYMSKSLEAKVYIARQINTAKDFMRSLYCKKESDI